MWKSAGTLLLGILFFSPSFAHFAPGTPELPQGFEYNRWCCSGKDCEPVADTDVWADTVDGKYGFWVKPHPRATHNRMEFVPIDAPTGIGDDLKVKVSPDHHYHVCRLSPDHPVRCLYVPFSG